jgi:hypothetical protein
MDAKTLAKIVQIVVREEVGKIVRKELATIKKQIVAEVKKSIPTPPVYEQAKSNQADSLDDLVGNVLQRERVARPTATQPEKTLSNNPVINNILNETAGFGGSTEDYPTMGGQHLTNNDVAGNEASDFRAMMSKRMGMKSPDQTAGVSIQEMMPTTNPEGAPMRTQQVPDSVAKALTRDYTELVKAMPKKR